MLLMNHIERLSMNQKSTCYSTVEVKIQNSFLLVSCWAFVYMIINTKEIQSAFFSLNTGNPNILHGNSPYWGNSWYFFSERVFVGVCSDGAGLWVSASPDFVFHPWGQMGPRSRHHIYSGGKIPPVCARIHCLFFFHPNMWLFFLEVLSSNKHSTSFMLVLFIWFCFIFSVLNVGTTDSNKNAF